MPYEKQPITQEQIDRYKANQRRIMRQSIFSSLCRLFSGNVEPDIDKIWKRAGELVCYLEQEYPTEKTQEMKEEEQEENLDKAIEETEKRLEKLRNMKNKLPF